MYSLLCEFIIPDLNFALQQSSTKMCNCNFGFAPFAILDFMMKLF